METLSIMKEEYIPEGIYEKFNLCIEEQSENLHCNPKLQGVELTGSPVFEIEEKLNKHIESTIDITITELD